MSETWRYSEDGYLLCGECFRAAVEGGTEAARCVAAPPFRDAQRTCAGCDGWRAVILGEAPGRPEAVLTTVEDSGRPDGDPMARAQEALVRRALRAGVEELRIGVWRGD